jgi:hypothetical protein
VNFSEQPPSNQWSALKYKGEIIAEVWFKPEGAPLALTFRIPQTSFQNPAMTHRLTAENLLKAVAISSEEVESWLCGDASQSGELGDALPPPPPDVAHLNICISLKQPPSIHPSSSPEESGKGEGESGQPEIPLAKWQELEARWKSILGVEATIENMRSRMESLRAEMEASFKKTLTTEEKVHALNADVAQWNKAKSRVHYVLPKAREFIQRATWAGTTPERKNLAELYKNHISPQIPYPQMNKLPEQLENLLKDRQVLSAHGVTVFQECQTVFAYIQETLKTLQSRAAANARRNRAATRPKGEFFK